MPDIGQVDNVLLLFTTAALFRVQGDGISDRADGGM